MLLKPPPSGEVEIGAWLFIVASNLSFNHIRTLKRRTEPLDRHLADETEIDHPRLRSRLLKRVINCSK